MLNLVCVSYFKPSNIAALKPKKWGDKERELLIKAIQKHGIGAWPQVRDEFLPQWASVLSSQNSK